MAKKKNKRKKSSAKIVRLSPQKYIRSKVRGLPIKECLVTEGWQEIGVATIIVAREQPSGNITLATFLVDKMCLGVKDTGYYHNLTPYEYQDLVNTFNSVQNMFPCRYEEAHNLIYGAIAFAEDLGFKPDDDFAITKHFLEEDNETVELIEYEFGQAGKPVLFVNEDMNPGRYINQLNKSVGEGNYEVVHQADDLYDEGWAENDHFDFDRPFRHFLENYQPPVAPNDGLKDLRMHSIEISYDAMETEYDARYEQDIDKIRDLVAENYEMIFDDENIEDAVPVLRDYVQQYPEYPTFYNHLLIALKKSGYAEEAWELAQTLYDKFPEYLFAKIGYGYELMEQGKVDEAFSVMENKYNIMDLYPDTKRFHVTEMLSFNLFVCHYLVEKGVPDQAVPYYRIMYSLDEDHIMTLSAEKLLGSALLKDKLGKMIEEEEKNLPEK